MVLCTLALIPEGGTGLGSPRGRRSIDRGRTYGVDAQSVLGISVGPRGPLRREMTVPLALAIAGG